ncbi:MAG: hypothetical protein NXY57DRAFT_487858 [Lentinula lateritia]|uniref:Uncharacterized protein n=1 Tax=Lentinula lateritia TaxID=40482 RepID=A0ABQ8V4S6_9AGAR|nr:MAG: hypothetical protein NXY57DRAFT_487858 [Lentinula lateritia]KAJ4474207.1 hypothetical protein C8R41DRAFT_559395 [Lentinula lateritia]
MSSVFVNTEATAPSALYVPVHKRTTSRGGASSRDSLSSRSTTPTSSEHDSSIGTLSIPIYSIQDLLLLSGSLLATLSPEQHDHLKDHAPEILPSRRQRKTIEHQRHYQGHAPGEVHPKEDTRQPLSSVRNTQPTTVQRRTLRQGRLPERRRYGKRITDELSWRASRTRTISATGFPLPLAPTAIA